MTTEGNYEHWSKSDLEICQTWPKDDVEIRLTKRQVRNEPAHLRRLLRFREALAEQPRRKLCWNGRFSRLRYRLISSRMRLRSCLCRFVLLKLHGNTGRSSEDLETVRLGARELATGFCQVRLQRQLCDTLHPPNFQKLVCGCVDVEAVSRQIAKPFQPRLDNLSEARSRLSSPPIAGTVSSFDSVRQDLQPTITHTSSTRNESGLCSGEPGNAEGSRHS